MKKFISVALVASMVASMGVTAFADTEYRFKDKQLEFSNELLYDGRGADELWLPITVDGKFIADSNKSVATIAADLFSAYEDAEEERALFNTVVTGLNAGGFADKAAISAFLADPAGDGSLPEVKELEASDKDLAGDAWVDADAYAKQLALVYTRGPLKAAETQKKNLEQIMKIMGDTNYDGTIEVADNVVDIDEIEDVNDVEIEWKAKRGGNLVANVDIDEVDDLGGIYCVVFELNDNLGTAVQYFNGTLRMENGKNRELDEQDIRYNYYNKAAYTVTSYTGNQVGDIENGFELDGTDNYINLVDFNDAYTICFFKKNAEWLELEDNNGFYYEVELSDQGKINLIYNNEAIDAVTDVASQDAVLAFYNFEARPIFDFPGKVVLTPDDEFLEEKDIEELYLYTYNKDGSLKAVKTRLGEDGDTIEFRTNQLGKYVLSTEQLTLLSDAERAALEAMKEAEANGEAVVEEAVVADEKANPSTGC